MARQEQDREDLLAEATALVERAELKVDGEPESVVVGFRKSGSLSLYFGGEPVYQFNSSGEFRRAFVDGLLYKADRGRLASLRRERNESSSQLLRRDLNATECQAFLGVMNQRIGRLRRALQAQQYSVVGQVPEDADVIARTLTALEKVDGTTVASSARTQ